MNVGMYVTHSDKRKVPLWFVLYSVSLNRACVRKSMCRIELEGEKSVTPFQWDSI